MSAAAAFEAVPELVENMLLRLPLPDILLAQQVSRSWKALIKKSPTLQRALFFRPSHDVQLVEVHYANKCTQFPCNCMTRSKPKRGYVLPRTLWLSPPICRWAVAPNDTRDYHIVVNPFLAAFPYTPKGKDHTDGRFEVSKFPGQVFTGASWRKMFITQPPVKELMVQYFNSRGRARHAHKIQAKPGSSGITFDDIRFHGRYEEIAVYSGSRHFKTVEPTAGRVVVCTPQDVMDELVKNDAGGSKE